MDKSQSLKLKHSLRNRDVKDLEGYIKNTNNYVQHLRCKCKDCMIPPPTGSHEINPDQICHYRIWFLKQLDILGFKYYCVVDEDEDDDNRCSLTAEDHANIQLCKMTDIESMIGELHFFFLLHYL